jgi:hypothetical protein
MFGHIVNIFLQLKFQISTVVFRNFQWFFKRFGGLLHVNFSQMIHLQKNFFKFFAKRVETIIQYSNIACDKEITLITNNSPWLLLLL